MKTLIKNLTLSILVMFTLSFVSCTKETKEDNGITQPTVTEVTLNGDAMSKQALPAGTLKPYRYYYTNNGVNYQVSDIIITSTDTIVVYFPSTVGTLEGNVSINGHYEEPKVESNYDYKPYKYFVVTKNNKA